MTTKTCACCGLQKSVSAFGKNKNHSMGLQNRCRSCRSAAAKDYYRRVKPKVAAKYAAQKTEVLLARSKYYEANREQKLQYLAEYRQKNAAYLKVTRTANQWRVTRAQAARRAKIKHASVPLSLALQAEIDGMYRFCSLFAGFEVDHIVPLSGKTVSGLHAPWNLQVLPEQENRKKKNRFDLTTWPAQGEIAHV